MPARVVRAGRSYERAASLLFDTRKSPRAGSYIDGIVRLSRPKGWLWSKQSPRGGSIERDPNDLTIADTYGAGRDVRRPASECDAVRRGQLTGDGLVFAGARCDLH
jgi:hypothetical protein